MAIQHNVLPDCTLSALRIGNFPADMRRPFLREAARACARYVQGGGNLCTINPETSCLRGGRLILQPLPAGAATLPSRASVEAGLAGLNALGIPPDLRDPDRLRFFLNFCDVLAKEDPLWLSWSRLWLKEQEQAVMRQSRAFFRNALRFDLSSPPQIGVWGAWLGHVETDAGGLLHAIRHLSGADKTLLKAGPRATVWSASLLGEDAVIKYFEPNPRAWRRRLDFSRARYAWAGTRLMRTFDQNVPDLLGFLECFEDGVSKEGYIIHRRIADAEPFGMWLMRKNRTMGDVERKNLRHRLREEFLRLYRRGIYHKDTKTHNLLVRELPGGALKFWWIDLEDIRTANGVAFWKVIRNLYQLNSSLPNRIPVRERLAFARGLRTRYPLATHPLVLRHIEHKSRRRLRREVKSRTRS
jgi:hypothetical protein